MRRSAETPAGGIHRLVLDSRRLAGNLLGDAPRRDVLVHVPAGHDGRGLPLLVDLVGFMGGGPSHANWKNFGENLPERLDRLVHEGRMAPCVVAMPDCFTRLGGNQYINSPATGPWMDVICDEVVPLVEARLGCGGAGRRGVFGKSSGGYGALVHAMLRPDVWSAAACHSGDMGFEWVYLPDMPATLRALSRHDMSAERFLRHIETAAARKIDGKDTHALMILAMAATYDPDPSVFGGIRLPVTLDTCEIIPDRWANWLAWDPLTLAPKHRDALRSMKALFIDCGDRDQYNLIYGARRLHAILGRGGVGHRYEEFPDDHSGIDYRLDESLPALAAALSA
jgi:S-formylglutathione hydrolase FrmB